MNNKDFINALATQNGSTAKAMQKWVNTLTSAIADKLDDDTQLSVQSFGTFEVKKKLERVVVNLATKQRKLIPPKLVLAFKPSTTLKEKIR